MRSAIHRFSEFLETFEPIPTIRTAIEFLETADTKK